MVPIGAIEVPRSSVRQAIEDAREVGTRDDAAPLDLKVRIKLKEMCMKRGTCTISS
jgi:hypothetical protein